MTPSGFVVVIAVVTFALGIGGMIVFDAPRESAQVAGVDWIVRALVGLAVAHTCVVIFGAVEQQRAFGQGDHTAKAAFLSESLAGALAWGGALIALATLLHLLSRRNGERAP